MALDPTGGINTTPFAQNDYGKRLEHVSLHHTPVARTLT